MYNLRKIIDKSKQCVYNLNSAYNWINKYVVVRKKQGLNKSFNLQKYNSSIIIYIKNYTRRFPNERLIRKISKKKYSID